MLETIPMGPLDANCYLLYQKEGGEAVLIDPSDGERALLELEKRNLRLTHILLTHRHYDHLAGVAFLSDALHPEVLIHPLDEAGLSDPATALDAWMGGTLQPARATKLVSDGDTFTAAGYSFRVLHTPGHTEGGVCYISDDERIVFTGDTVFCDGCGRTDLPTGNMRVLIRSVLEKLLVLPADYIFYPGHGEPTTAGHEAKFNPLNRYRRLL